MTLSGRFTGRTGYVRRPGFNASAIFGSSIYPSRHRNATPSISRANHKSSFYFFILFLWSADPSIRAREKRNGARDADLCIFRRSNCRAEAIGCAYSGDRAASRQYCVCLTPLMCFFCAPDGQVTVAKSASVRPGQNFVTSWAFFSFAGKPVDRGNRC